MVNISGVVRKDFSGKFFGRFEVVLGIGGLFFGGRLVVFGFGEVFF